MMVMMFVMKLISIFCLHAISSKVRPRLCHSRGVAVLHASSDMSPAVQDISSLCYKLAPVFGRKRTALIGVGLVMDGFVLLREEQ